MIQFKIFKLIILLVKNYNQIVFMIFKINYVKKLQDNKLNVMMLIIYMIVYFHFKINV